MSYHAPTDLPSLLSLVSDGAGSIVAGGTDFYPALQTAPVPDRVIDLTRVADLRGISISGRGYHIGAATTWSDLINTPLPPAFDGLKQAAREVGSVQIQNAATVAGNLCNASPAADGVPPLLTLDTEVELASAARGTRRLPLPDFLCGVRKTVRAPDEVLTALHIPTPPEVARSAFEKLGSRRYLVISIAMVAVLVDCDADGVMREARVAIGACSPVAQRLPQLEASLVGKKAGEVTVTRADLASLSPIDDVRGSAPYRLDAAAAQIRRALHRAARDE